MARYRLPADFPVGGGSEIDAVYRGKDGSRHIYDHASVRLGFPVPLDEVAPPSIDDPEPLPVEIVDATGGVLTLDTAGGGWDAIVTATSGPHRVQVGLASYGLRQLARAAWQRADEVDPGRAS